MALSVANKLSGGTDADNTAFVTSSWTPVNGNTYLLWCGATAGTANPTPTPSGNGITWTLVASVLHSNTFNAALLGGQSLYCFRGVASGSSTTGAITISYNMNCTSAFHILDEWGSPNGAPTVTQSATWTSVGSTGTTAGSPSQSPSVVGTRINVILGTTLTAGNAVTMGGHHDNANGATTPMAGYTLLADLGGAAPLSRLFTERNLAPSAQNADATWATTAATRAGIALEVAEPPPPPPVAGESWGSILI